MNGRKMKKVKSLSFLTCVLLLSLTGCAGSQRYETVKQICVPDTDKAEAMQIAEDVLGKMNFTIDKADAELGIIRSKPLQGAQFFEFWRKDTIGSFNRAEANLHSIRKIVELDIKQEDQRLCVGCDVEVQRLSIPERRVTGWRAYEMFSESDSSMQRLELDPKQKTAMAWVDLGQDDKLGTLILKRIEKRLKGK
jgi:hypothetical protein